jgi:hypothetical protein
MSSKHFAHLTIALCALAVGTTIDVTNAQEVRRVEFTKFVSNSCPASGSCFVDFGTVPADRAWLIRYVSCYLIIGNQNGRPLYWYLYAVRNGNVIGRIHLRPAELGATSTERTFNATEQGYMKVPFGSTVGLSVTRDSSTAGAINGIQCSIGGDNIVLQ